MILSSKRLITQLEGKCIPALRAFPETVLSGVARSLSGTTKLRSLRLDWCFFRDNRDKNETKAGPRYLLLLCLLIASPGIFAGVLDEFEKDTTVAEKRDENETDTEELSSASSNDSARLSGFNSECDAVFGCFMDELIWGAMQVAVLTIVEGGKMSLERIRGGEPLSSIVKRDAGEPLLPFIRLDSHYQNAESDIAAVDVKAELGYSLIGVGLRQTRFSEPASSDELDLRYVHLLYRMSLGNHIGFNIGYGRATLEGDKKNSGGSITFPLLYHWSPRLGLEGVYTASDINGNLLTDAELALVMTIKPVSLLLGYRTVRSPSQDIKGFFSGLAVHW